MDKKAEIMISLLGRLCFPEDKLRNLIVRNKRNPEAYVRGYNACNGRRAVNEIARIVGVTSGTLVPILQEWERLGIAFVAEPDSRNKCYQALYALEE
jgi:hypothetical protein